MPIFEPGSIVRVPFPYTDRETRQHRPALVISNGGIGPGKALIWVAMITSAANRRWADDVPIEEDHQSCGLPVASLVRPAKIATIDAAAAETVGKLDPLRMERVRAAIMANLGIGR